MKSDDYQLKVSLLDLNLVLKEQPKDQDDLKLIDTLSSLPHYHIEAIYEVYKSLRVFITSSENSCPIPSIDIAQGVESYINAVSKEIESKGKYDFGSNRPIYIYEAVLDYNSDKNGSVKFKSNDWFGEGFYISKELIHRLIKEKILTKKELYSLQLDELDSHRDIVLDIVKNCRIYLRSEEFIKEYFKDQKYVLIIDEINRANLSSVLGELVYGLEYRDCLFSTPYRLNGSNTVCIPSNLYIIGTMNTADKSIGHIDYAIRRRFAFQHILPKREVIPTAQGKKLFDKVQDIFHEDNLSSDFNKDDIQLGHSYFLGDEDQLSFRLNFEIKPLLREYVKDGVLINGSTEQIEGLSIQ